MVEYPSFCFDADLVFQEKTSSLRECWILKSVNFSILHFACAQKLYPIYEHFQHPVYAFYRGWNVTKSSYILLFSAWVLEAVTQD